MPEENGNGNGKGKLYKLVRGVTLIILAANFIYMLNSSFVLNSIERAAAAQRAEFLEKLDAKFLTLESKYLTREAAVGRAALVDERLKSMESCCRQFRRHTGLEDGVSPPTRR